MTIALHAAFRCIGLEQLLSPCYVLTSHQKLFYTLKRNSRLSLTGRLQQRLSEFHWTAHAYGKIFASHIILPLLRAIYSLIVYNTSADPNPISLHHVSQYPPTFLSPVPSPTLCFFPFPPPQLDPLRPSVCRRTEAHWKCSYCFSSALSTVNMGFLAFFIT